MRDTLASNGVLLVVQDEDDLCGVLEMIDQGIDREEMVPNEEHEVQEGPELDCPAMAYALGVFDGSKAEVEPQLYQVDNMPGFCIGGGGSCRHDGVDNAQGGVAFSRLNRGYLVPYIFSWQVRRLSRPA